MLFECQCVGITQKALPQSKHLSDFQVHEKWKKVEKKCYKQVKDFPSGEIQLKGC